MFRASIPAGEVDAHPCQTFSSQWLLANTVCQTGKKLQKIVLNVEMNVCAVLLFRAVLDPYCVLEVKMNDLVLEVVPRQEPEGKRNTIPYKR
jgi:hypothetical protein